MNRFVRRTRTRELAAFAATLVAVLSIAVMAPAALAQGLPPPGTPPAAGGAQRSPTTGSTTLASKVEAFTALAADVKDLCGESPPRPDIRAKLPAWLAGRLTIEGAKVATEQKTIDDIVGRVGQICDALGTELVGGGIDIRPFTDTRLAAIAITADGPTVRAIARYASKEFVEIDQTIEEKNENATDPLKRAKKNAESLETTLSAGILPASSFAVDLASLALEGLAKLVLDRAQFESAGWFLEQVGDRLCKNRTNPRVATEMRDYWMPAICELTGPTLYDFGAGSALWSSLVAATKKDVQGIPGAAAGLGIGALFLSDAAPDTSVFVCDDPDSATKPALCVNTRQLRSDTAASVRAILQGGDATEILGAWSGKLDASNPPLAPAASGGPTPPASMSLALVACGASLPAFLKSNRPDFVEALGADAIGPLAVASLYVSASCQRVAFWTIKIQGYKLGSSVSGDQKLTHIAGRGVWGTPELSDLAASVERLAKVALAFEAPAGETRTTPPALTLATSDPAAIKAAVGTAVDSTTAADSQQALVRRVGAVFDLVDASLDVVVASANLYGKAQSTAGPPKTVDPSLLVKLRGAVGLLRDTMAIGRSVAAQQWGDALMGVAKLVASAESLSAASTSTVSAHLKAETKDLGVLVAILGAKDGDEMAKALNSLADPPGGWRGKQRDKQFTVALSAHVGLYGGFEFRQGSYGAVHERGAPVYGVAPTLGLPLGVDFSFGTSCGFPDPVSLFVSVLDPAAFLGYDTAKAAKLPGPSLVTALSPGLGLNLGFGGSPFGIMPFFMVRPGYRQTTPDPVGFGATAYQGGLLLNVDVTLWTIAGRSL